MYMYEIYIYVLNGWSKPTLQTFDFYVEINMVRLYV